jgi:hypothetical protein
MEEVRVEFLGSLVRALTVVSLVPTHVLVSTKPHQMDDVQVEFLVSLVAKSLSDEMG